MILFQLKCADGHGFEAWFRNGASYDEQAAQGSILCPACGTDRVAKAPMAPRIAKGRTSSAAEEKMVQVQGELLSKLRALRQEVERTADYVGDRFAEEARKIHYDEVEARPIYGQATPDEAAELKDEGIAVARIPWVPTHDA